MRVNVFSKLSWKKRKAHAFCQASLKFFFSLKKEDTSSRAVG